MIPAAITVAIEITPPITTDETNPSSRAASPDSNAPNSFDVPTKMLFTALTLPRMLSGVINCNTVARTTTLTLSNTPLNNNKLKLSKKFVDTANNTMHAPNAPTHHNIAQPARLVYRNEVPNQSWTACDEGYVFCLFASRL